MLKYLILTSIIFTAKAFASNNTCDFLITSSKVKGLLSSLQSEMQVKESWQNYRLSQNPVVLLELGKNQNCGILVLNGQIVSTIHSVLNLKLGNNAYGFLKDGKSLGDELGDTPASLADLGVTTALFWNLDFAWPAEIPAGFQLGLMAHEGFHLFRQGTQNAWPQWPTDRGQFSSSAIRKELVQKCYNGTPDITVLADQELQSLVSASRAAVVGDINGARSSAHNFTQARVSRYKLLKNTEVNLNGNSSISCPDAEASFEFNEGIPDYVFYATSLNSSQIDFETLVSFLISQYQPSEFRESYYAFGGLQLLTLSKLVPDFVGFQKSLLSSTTPSEGIFSKFQSETFVVGSH